MTIPFAKYHGLGNDFVLIETTEPFHPAHVSAICHRHSGIGADGILLVGPHPTTDARMIVLNPDGSRPGMCGNGLRCVAFHLAAKHHHHPTTTTLQISTDAGPKTCAVSLDPPSPQATVQTDLGPVDLPQHRTIHCDGHNLDLITTSVGNPHAILFNPSVPFHHFASRIATHPDFPHGTNVSFVSLQDHELHTRVWERGAGPTLACGTAACAVAAAAISQSILPPNHTVPVRLPGGLLHVLITTDRHAVLTGPARHVFDGVLPAIPKPLQMVHPSPDDSLAPHSYPSP